MAQLLSNLPIGSKVKFGKYSVEGGVAQEMTWIVVAKNHNSTPAYPINSVTLMTEKIIDVFPIDVAEPNNTLSDVRINGNATYRLTNIDQWLNKDGSAGTWYEPTHPSDVSPNDGNVLGGRGYAKFAAFLNAFSQDEKSIILNTTIRCRTANVGSDDISRKVFLASGAEIGIKSSTTDEGSAFEYFVGGANVKLQSGVTEQFYRESNTLYKPNNITGNYSWWTRSTADVSYNHVISDNGFAAYNQSCYPYGIRPVLNLPSSTEISETADGNGSYGLVWNTAPLSPTEIYSPSIIYGGKPNSVSWPKAVDVDGDTITYTLECSIDGGEYTEIYNGTSVAYAHLVPFGSLSVSYRVKATDPFGQASPYTTSAIIGVVNNAAPVISGVDSNLGVISDDFTGTYTITDANGDVVTVTEAIDGVQIRTIIAPLGETITYGVTESTWLALSNGSHTLTITATDGIDTTVRTLVFTKLADKFTIRNSTPWVSSTMPSRIMLVVTRNIPSTSTFKVEVCNNGYDASPTWEDATAAVLSGLVHVFSNESKTATDWGVVVKVTVERNGATGACYVSAIGGNFE